MGIIFDGRKFNSKRSPQGELNNVSEMNRFSEIARDALQGDDYLSFKLTKNSLVVKSKATRFSGDPTLKTLTIKGSFDDVDPNDEKTWKSAKVDKISYKGKDGIINVKETGNKGSLGSLYDWENVERFDEFVFRGDDIIYSDKKTRSDHSLSGYDGDDTFYLYSEEDVEGGKGKDKFIVTKNAVKYKKRKGGDAEGIQIDDASSVQGDIVEIAGNESVFNIIGEVQRGGSEPRVVYENESFYLDIYFTKKPVFADFVTG